ncbi:MULTISPECIES: plasmid mobilization relaxosome protein MobC [Bacillota]|uniref:Plasmid mobilization relaxosome protein MobC n=1 Tax=Finegoldia magna TaxID=1260 RepID=A0A233VYC3_FINMA|nr:MULTISPECIES: plasmid mobilization relaxosome protein MobC [Peptoniphilaceae]MBS6611295.1 plasmid mobilization relaxosome protein MobC [Peptoniphilus harei]MDU1043973.1 plasmid mobilization relaxosome protein MobC [Peptoniphilus rhinitidis]MDU4277907.1 plasmid mobilization relaxosome protein MobC [Finegoldia magna]MDU5377687.1 plasmid mobilization relaxosome protein MobC [Peptoniphilus lacydonensis]MDU5437359.1 plasmid mobilization relaxosome protein MobC [Peptoniphilus lacydonensis]
MANRTRNNGIYLMLSDEELELLNKKYKASKCKSLRQFIIKCILEKDIFILDMDVFREMSTNISRTSSSINQIAKRVNSTSLIYKNDVDDLKKSLEKQAKDILSMRKKIYSLTYSNNFNTEKK